MAKRRVAKMQAGGQGEVASKQSPAITAAPAATLQETPAAPVSAPARESALLEDKGHLRADMRMMRALLRNPCYVPNEFFADAASDLMALSRKPEVDDRVKVGAIKTVTEIAKLNLKVNEVVANEGKSQQANAGSLIQVKVIVNLPDEKPQPKQVESKAVERVEQVEQVEAFPPASPGGT